MSHYIYRERESADNISNASENMVMNENPEILALIIVILSAANHVKLDPPPQGPMMCSLSQSPWDLPCLPVRKSLYFCSLLYFDAKVCHILDILTHIQIRSKKIRQTMYICLLSIPFYAGWGFWGVPDQEVECSALQRLWVWGCSGAYTSPSTFNCRHPRSGEMCLNDI